MAEPMSAETNPQGERLKQKKEEVVEQLKKQNDALGGNVLRFIQRTDGSELILFTQPNSLKDGLGRYGGYCDGAVTLESTTVDKLMSKFPRVVEEATRNLRAGGGFLSRVSSDQDFDLWKDSLKMSEEYAANKIKHERADAHYTPKLLEAIGEMPNVLAASGFDLHAEMRKVQATAEPTPMEDTHHYQEDLVVTSEKKNKLPSLDGGEMIDYAFANDADAVLRTPTPTATEIPTATETPTMTQTGTNTPKPVGE